MKKIRRIATIIALLMLSVVCICACGDTKENNTPPVGSLSNVGNESFKGTLSEETYNSSEDAARDFLRNELDGSTTSTTFVSYAKKSELTEEELAELPLGDLEVADIVSAESGTVTYVLSTTSGYSLTAASSGNQRTQTLYIIQLEDGFRYFVPDQRNGEMISKSYYEDIWNLENYTNCTMSAKVVVSIDAKSIMQQAHAEVTVSLDMKCTENAIWMKMTPTVKAEGDGAEEIAQSIASEFSNMEVYLVEHNATLYACMKSNGTWQASRAPFSSLGEFFMANNRQPEFFDHTYFEKTDNGFAIAPEKFNLYLQKSGLTSGYDATGEATYFVKDEHLAKTTVRFTLSMSQSGVSMKTTSSAVCEYSNYGTTTVSIPADLTAYLESLN